MEESNQLPSSNYRPLVMSDKELRKIIDLVYAECGIALSEAKRSMASARLGKRVRSLGLSSFGEYFEFVHSPKGREQELTEMIDAITTNTTEFFRESKHFEFLNNQALPILVNSEKFNIQRRLNVWSAGCSTGEEPYTLAMVLSEFFRGDYNAFQILATDISTRVLLHARRAVYQEGELSGIPLLFRHKYLMRGIGPQKGHYRIIPEIRNRVSLNRVNFMDERFDLPSLMDVIFCRNVIIYFDTQTRIELISKFCRCLAPGGFLFMGHSESLNGINDELALVAPTIYRKPE